MCTDLPKGYVVNVSFNGRPGRSGTGCDADGTLRPRRRTSGCPSRRTTPDAPCTSGPGSAAASTTPTPLPAGSVPGLRDRGRASTARSRSDRWVAPRCRHDVERDGHTWQLTVGQSSTGAPIDLPAAPRDRIAAMAWHTHGSHQRHLRALRTTRRRGRQLRGGGQAGLPGLWVPAGAPVRASLDSGERDLRRRALRTGRLTSAGLDQAPGQEHQGHERAVEPRAGRRR